MAFIDISAWTTKHVVDWLRGVHKTLENFDLSPILDNKVDGTRLLMMGPENITDLLNVDVDTSEAIIEGAEMLRYLQFESRYETLQSLMLKLACKSRFLLNHLMQGEPSPKLIPLSSTTTTPMPSSFVPTDGTKNFFDFSKIDSNLSLSSAKPGQQRVTLQTLDSVSDILEYIKYIVNWLDKSKLSDIKLNGEFKSILLRLAVELASTSQRDQFVEYPNDILKKTCKFLADYCDYIVIAFVDADYVQSCRLDIVGLTKKSNHKDYGFTIRGPLFWFHLVDNVSLSSGAHVSGRISNGDELIQIDYQTVVGWPLESVIDLLNRYPIEVTLTLRKKPFQESNNCIASSVLKPFPIPLKKSREIESRNSPPEINKTIQSAHEKIIVSTCNEENSPAMTPSTINTYESSPEPTTSQKPKGQLRRRASISGSISDALVDLTLGDALPIPKADGKTSAKADKTDISMKSMKCGKITKESLTKSFSHDTAKLYLHTLSIDKKHLW